jgi:uncharacterized protein (DUF2267 family)
MDRERFISIVAGATGLDRDGAERATRAVLQTLADHLDRGEARDLADQLPPELAPWVARGEREAERFDVDEFLRRVAEREGADVATAERDALAVFAALGQAVSPREISDVLSQLPKDFARLLPRGPDIEVMTADTFVERVAERTGLDVAGARHAVDAVLETLAERIAGGEVEDLISRLPVTLHGPLRRGTEHSGGRAMRMSIDTFLRRVAEHERVSPLEAREHAHAVFATLREAVGDDEFFDVTVQLPPDYEPVVARP